MDYEKDQIHYVKSTSSTIICKNFVKIDQREVPQKVLQAVFKNDRARSFFTLVPIKCKPCPKYGFKFGEIAILYVTMSEITIKCTLQ